VLRQILLVGLIVLAACQSEEAPTKNADVDESVQGLGVRHDRLESAADELMRAGQYAKAVHVLGAAIVVHPGDPALYGKRAFALRMSGAEHLARADRDTARRLTLRALDRRIASKTADVQLRLQRAALRAEAGQLAAAQEDGRVAAGLAPMDAHVHFVLGNLSVRAAASADALTHYGEALRLAPGLGEAYAARGALSQSLGDVAGAQVDLDRARALAMRTDTAINDR